VSPTAIALNRFGLGARPNESTPSDPQRWLLAQFEKYDVHPPAWRAAKGSAALVETWLTQQREARLAPEGQRSGVREAYLRQGREEYIAATGARTDSAMQSDTPFVERLVHFWSNHFAVSVDKLLVVGLAGGFELDAIRPNVLGRFEDLLLAVVRHPAMLLYLDQAQSIGPNSIAARRQSARQPRGRGLNENLAREILELHTLGVRSGYTQEDVTELARALTGWTLPGDGPGESAGASFRFVGALHEPGQRTVLGQSYPDNGEQQSRAILHDLVALPATAQHIAGKLARHFVADNPPPALVQRLANTFMRTSGDLSSLYRELVASPEVWGSAQAKFKSPWEWGVSSLRALGRREMPSTQAGNFFTQLGQPVWRPGSPAGYADLNATWAAPDALIRRVETAQRMARQAGNSLDARTLAPQILPGGALSQATAGAIARADSGETALALLLVAPEFLRR
jgi:uncharacterized protein (DUF1800 family)